MKSIIPLPFAQKPWYEYLQYTTRKEYWSFILVFFIYNILFQEILNLFDVELISPLGWVWILTLFVLSLYQIVLFIGRFRDAGYPALLAVALNLTPFITLPLIWICLDVVGIFSSGCRTGLSFSFIAIVTSVCLSLWVTVQPTSKKNKAKTIVEDNGVQFTIENDENLTSSNPQSEEVARLVAWFIERQKDGVTSEELIRAMRDSGHPEDRIQEVLLKINPKNLTSSYE
jgi:uncharacterized membrane protein YhaH (DUF805 family)